MTSNETLKLIRELINDGESADFLLVEAFEELDNWLKDGGSLPDDWKQQPRLEHEFIPDGRPGFDSEDDICVSSGSSGLCGRPRREHK